MLKEYNKKLILEDGSEYYGYSFGDTCDKICEIVFNTSMVGYQEIISDPSYTYQAVVMTYPLIGNYGINEDDNETEKPTLAALIVSEYNDLPSNFRCTNTADAIMKRFGIPGIYGVDTRRLTRHIRSSGFQRVLVTGINTDMATGIRLLSETPVPTDAVSLVSRKAMQQYLPQKSDYRVVAIDCGIKQNIVRSLLNKNCAVTVVPYNTTAKEIEVLKPDGLILSNGPGNPCDVPEVINTFSQLRGKYPTIGICLGHQIICLAYGATCSKLKFGHHGGNHPVRNLLSGKVEITSQNHSYTVDESSLENTPLVVTHVNLLDNTVEGVKCEKDNVFSVQFHPESAPGPEDSTYLFDSFIKLMEANKNA